MKKIILIGSEGVLGNYYKKELAKNCKLLVAGDKIFKSKSIKKVQNVYIDLNDQKNIKNFFVEIKKKFGDFDILINNAAFTTEETVRMGKKISANFENFDNEIWDKTIAVNLTGVYLSCKYFIKYFHKKNLRQKIINVGSIYGSHSPHHNIYSQENFFSNIAYTSSKSGLIGLTKWLATKYINQKTNVNIISPSGVFNNHNQRFLKKYLEILPINKMAKPSDIYGLIEFLISDKSDYITGQNIFADGGFSSW